MKRIKDIISLPVLALDTGTIIGKVGEVIYSIVNRKVIALLVDRMSIINSKLAVTLDAIVNIGNDCVTITSKNALTHPKQITAIVEALNEQQFKHQRVINSLGDDIGIIDDIVIDENSGLLVAVDISGGVVSDLIYGRQRMELPDNFSLSKANCILQKGAEDEYLFK